MFRLILRILLVHHFSINIFIILFINSLNFSNCLCHIQFFTSSCLSDRYSGWCWVIRRLEGDSSWDGKRYPPISCSLLSLLLFNIYFLAFVPYLNALCSRKISLQSKLYRHLSSYVHLMKNFHRRFTDPWRALERLERTKGARTPCIYGQYGQAWIPTNQDKFQFLQGFCFYTITTLFNFFGDVIISTV